ncbi:hypothetical protein ACFYM0_33430 [Streptomyces sp. NPDC006487]|uniref:COG1470 family protein n=1 Tax=Streptomyces sp. NPDC006487 TaxID=3364748 RepID=UPI0036A64451
MGVIASLDDREIAVEAGESATCAVRLHNDGRTVDTFTLDVLGEVAAWTSIEPESVNVFPGDDAVAVVTFAPPRSAEVPCGTKAFALRVMAQEDTDGSVIEEGTVEVLGYSEVAAELVPRTARGARTARTKLAVDNFGNGPVTVQFTGKDESGAVAFSFKPAQTVVEGGTTQLIPVRMKMKQRFLTGQPKTVPVEIGLTASDGAKLETTGVVVQPALLPRWFPKALTFAVAGVILLTVMGPVLFDARPTSKAISGGRADAAGGPGTGTGAGAQASPSQGPSQTPGTPPSPTPQQTGGAAQGQGQNGGQAPPAGSTGGGGEGGAGGSGGSGGSQGASTGDRSDGSGGAAKPPAGGGTQTVSENIRIPGRGNTDSSGFLTSSRVVGPGQTITVGEVVVSNQVGSAGTMEIRKDNTVLLELDLATTPSSYRKHFPTPITFKSGEKMVVAVQCESESGTCTPGALFPSAKVTKG